MKTIIWLFLVLLCASADGPKAQAVIPPPDGGYPGYTTAEGTNTLQNLTTGVANTGLGWYALFTDSDGNYNTAVGAGALVLNNADANTATGVAALFLNTTGVENTANGAAALLNNEAGSDNTAIGYQALSSNTTGIGNTATGAQALATSASGIGNTANGGEALLNNSGNFNTAVGLDALLSNTSGSDNTAVGLNALSTTTGSGNTALGANAGSALTTGNNNIDIGAGVTGVAGDANTIRIGNPSITATIIRGISGTPIFTGNAVYVDANGMLGTIVSSRRFKEQIEPMDQASEALYLLKPVSFRYKNEIDPTGTRQFGLVAEEVEKVDRDLVVRDEQGRTYSVRYDQVNAMLLNEFLKEHATVQEQGAKIVRLEKQIQTLAAGLQKVSAQLEVSKAAPQTVLNNH